MRLTLVSTRPALADKEANLKELETAVRKANGPLVAFPEMSLTGYLVRDHALRLAEGLDGPSVRRMQSVAEETGKWVVFGMPREDDDLPGLVYNSAVLVDPDGGVQAYDKRQLATFGPFEDGIFFTPGREPGLFETPWGRIGITICYDIFFPELTKAQALAGADLLLNISASPNTSRRFFEQLFPARAVECTLPIAYANFSGAQDGLMFWGGNQLWGPRGTLKARGPYYEPHALEVELDLEETRAARPLRPTLRDTREDIIVDLMRAREGTL